VAALVEGDRGHDEQAGGGVEVAGLARIDGGPMGGQDLLAPGVVERQAVGVGLVDATCIGHPVSVADRAENDFWQV
jgi:hypothetical protein